MKPWQKLTDLFKPTDINVEMTKKYKGTVLGVTTPEGKTSYGWYRGQNEDGLHVFCDQHENKFKLSPDTNCDVFIPKIERGLYNTSKGVVFVKRNPYRQYRRGLSADSYLVGLLSQMIFYKTISANMFGDLVFEVLQSKPCAQLATFVEDPPDIPTFALTKEFAISLNHTTEPEDYCLWFEYALIGFVSVKDKTIRMINPNFRQEILDTRHSWCQNFEVI